MTTSFNNYPGEGGFVSPFAVAPLPEEGAWQRDRARAVGLAQGLLGRKNWLVCAIEAPNGKPTQVAITTPDGRVMLNCMIRSENALQPGSMPAAPTFNALYPLIWNLLDHTTVIVYRADHVERVLTNAIERAEMLALQASWIDIATYYAMFMGDCQYDYLPDAWYGAETLCQKIIEMINKMAGCCDADL